MKKIMFAVAATAVVLSFGSCNNSSKETAASAEGTETVEAVEVIENQDSLPSTQATPQMSPSEYNAKAGAAYLDSLKANDKDVKFTESGLGYRVIKDAKGEKPTPSSTAIVKYTGKHIDGSVFDSSGDQTVPFPLTRVIPGFSEGISLMPVGSKYELYIPYTLGYGPQGTPGGPIGPCETLVFEVELVGIQ